MGIVLRLVTILLCTYLIPWNCFAINKESLIIKRGYLEEIVDKLATLHKQSSKVLFSDALASINVVNPELTTDQVFIIKKYLLTGCFSSCRSKLDIDTFFIEKQATDLSSIDTLRIPESYANSAPYQNTSATHNRLLC